MGERCGRCCRPGRAVGSDSHEEGVSVLIGRPGRPTAGRAKRRRDKTAGRGRTSAPRRTPGTAHDLAAVAILALAGLSFALTLASWIPPWLNRLGMEFTWSMNWGVLAYLFLGVKFGVTAYYGADVDAHRAAYRTSVLAVSVVARAWRSPVGVG